MSFYPAAYVAATSVLPYASIDIRQTDRVLVASGTYEHVITLHLPAHDTTLITSAVDADHVLYAVQNSLGIHRLAHPFCACCDALEARYIGHPVRGD